MRAHQILLEFNVEKTVEHYGDKVYYTINDKRRHDWTNKFTRVLFDEFRAKYNGENFHGRGEEYRELYDKFMRIRMIEELSKFDPTKGKYALWIVRLASTHETLPRYEDMGRVTDALQEFDQLKKSGFFVRNKDQAQFADINRFKTLSELEGFLDKISTEDSMSNNQMDKAKEKQFLADGEVEILLNNDTVKMVVPRSQAAAMYYGRNTRWCTAAKTNNMFEHYADDGDLYIVMDKKNNRRWQLHFESRQYMDERDHPIENWDNFPVVIFKYIPFEKFETMEIYSLISSIFDKTLTIYALRPVLANMNGGVRNAILVWFLMRGLFSRAATINSMYEPFKDLVLNQYATKIYQKHNDFWYFGPDMLSFIKKFIENKIAPTRLSKLGVISSMMSSIQNFTRNYSRMDAYRFILSDDGDVVIITNLNIVYSSYEFVDGSNVYTKDSIRSVIDSGQVSGVQLHLAQEILEVLDEGA